MVVSLASDQLPIGTKGQPNTGNNAYLLKMRLHVRALDVGGGFVLEKAAGLGYDAAWRGRPA